METPEQLVAAREARQKQARKLANEAKYAPLIPEIKDLIPKVLTRLAEQGYPPPPGYQDHPTIMWHGQELLSWLLRDGRGDGDYHQVHLISNGMLVETAYHWDQDSSGGYKAYSYAYGNHLETVVAVLRTMSKSEEERKGTHRETVTLVYPGGSAHVDKADLARANAERKRLDQEIWRLAPKAAKHQASLGFPGFQNWSVTRLSLGCDQGRGVGEVFLNRDGTVMRVQGSVIGPNNYRHEIDIRRFDNDFPVPDYPEAVWDCVRAQQHVIAELKKLLPPKTFLGKLFS